jgi:hypothetical protein
MDNEEIGEEIRGVLHALDTFCPASQYGAPDCMPGTEKELIEELLAELGGWMEIVKDRIDFDPYNPSRCHRVTPSN